MPHSPEDRRNLYNTPAWREQRDRVYARAGNRCECTGQCGLDHFDEWNLDEPELALGLALRQVSRAPGARCSERRGEPGAGDGVKAGGRVALGVAHKNHDTGKRVSDEELLALCAGCHLRYDDEQHTASLAATNARRATDDMLALEAAGQRRLL